MIWSLLPKQIQGLYEVNSLRFFFHFYTLTLYSSDSSLSSSSSYMWLFYLTTIVCDFHRYCVARVSCREMGCLDTINESTLRDNPQFSGKMMNQYFWFSFPCFLILGFSFLIFSFLAFPRFSFCRKSIVFILTIPLVVFLVSFPVSTFPSLSATSTFMWQYMW